MEPFVMRNGNLVADRDINMRALSELRAASRSCGLQLRWGVRNFGCSQIRRDTGTIHSHFAPAKFSGIHGRRVFTSSFRSLSHKAAWPLESILNLKKYPVHDSSDIRRRQLIEKCRAGLQQDGYFYLPHFIHEDALAVLFESCIQHEGICHTATSVRTVWNHPVSKAKLDASMHHDPSNLRQKYSKCVRGLVAMDEIAPSGPLRTLYESEELKTFLSQVRGEDAAPLCRLEDELGSCSVGIYSRGHSECWTFNRHALTAAVVVREANSGGRVQVLKNAYGPLAQHDKLVSAVVHTILCAAEVEQVGLSVGQHWSLLEVLKSMDETEQPTFFLKGALAVKNILARSGGLLITVGKQSLFRVAPVHGDEALVVGLLQYEESPGQRYGKEQREELFGRSRVGEERKEAAPMEGGEHRVYGYDEQGNLVEVESPPDLDLSALAELSEPPPGSPEATEKYKEAKAELEKDLGVRIDDGAELSEDVVRKSLEKGDT